MRVNCQLSLACSSFSRINRFSPAKLSVYPYIPFRNRRTLMAVTAALPVADDIGSNSIFFRPMKATVSAVRKFLLERGWREAWVDGVTAEITKRNLKTSVEHCEAVVRILTLLHFAE